MLLAEVEGLFVVAGEVFETLIVDLVIEVRVDSPLVVEVE